MPLRGRSCAPHEDGQCSKHLYVSDIYPSKRGGRPLRPPSRGGARMAQPCHCPRGVAPTVGATPLVNPDNTIDRVDPHHKAACRYARLGGLRQTCPKKPVQIGPRKSRETGPPPAIRVTDGTSTHQVQILTRTILVSWGPIRDLRPNARTPETPPAPRLPPPRVEGYHPLTEPRQPGRTFTTGRAHRQPRTLAARIGASLPQPASPPRTTGKMAGTGGPAAAPINGWRSLRTNPEHEPRAGVTSTGPRQPEPEPHHRRGAERVQPHRSRAQSTGHLTGQGSRGPEGGRDR